MVASTDSRRPWRGSGRLLIPLSDSGHKCGHNKWFRTSRDCPNSGTWRGFAGFLAAWAVVLAGWLLTARGAESAAAEPPRPPPVDQFIVIPLRVHVLTGDDEWVDCKLSEADVRRIIGKVNGVWRRAGVHFGVESIHREPAANVERFRRTRDQIGGTPLALYPRLIPEDTRRFGGLHVYYVHKLPVNGVYLGADYVFVQETATLREVEGGIDEPVPRVTSHELGHALGLPHRQDRTNLMASGTTGTGLNLAEMETARGKATKIAGAITVERAREMATGSKDDEATQRLRRWLAEVEDAAARK